MKFRMVDQVVERTPDRVVTIKQVSLAEEYLRDHFPGFPVLPGILMVEAMAQAARVMLGEEGDQFVLGQVKAMKFGHVVRPGDALWIEVELIKRLENGEVNCRASGRVLAATAEEAPELGATAATGRFTMRPVRTTAAIQSV